MSDAKSFLDDAAEARRLRAEAEAARENTVQAAAEQREMIERDARPRWNRMLTRRRQNGFGEDYDLSLTPRRAS